MAKKDTGKIIVIAGIGLAAQATKNRKDRNILIGAVVILLGTVALLLRLRKK